MTRTYRRPLVALLLALAVVATATIGSAATLTVNAASISTFTATNPCGGTAQASPTNWVGGSGKYTGVELVLPPGCSGTLQVAVLDGGSLLTTATVPAASGTIPIDVGQQYYPAGITVVGTLAGWHLPITFAGGGTPPASAITCTTDDPTRPCTATVVIRNDNVWAEGYDLDITITDARPGNSNDPSPWTITLDFSDSFYPWVPNALNGSGVVVESSCADLPLLMLSGVTTTWGEYHLLRQDTVRTVWIQPRNDGSGTLLTCP